VFGHSCFQKSGEAKANTGATTATKNHKENRRISVLR
jgi:hypothetical protein